MQRICELALRMPLAHATRFPCDCRLSVKADEAQAWAKTQGMGFFRVRPNPLPAAFCRHPEAISQLSSCSPLRQHVAEPLQLMKRSHSSYPAPPAFLHCCCEQVSTVPPGRGVDAPFKCVAQRHADAYDAAVARYEAAAGAKR